MAGAIVLERYSSIEEALVVQSLLKANGVKAELENGYHVQNDWFLIHALDGVGLVISAHDYNRSSSILSTARDDTSDLIESDQTDSDRKQNRRLIRRWSLPLLFYGFIGPVIYIVSALSAYVVQYHLLGYSDNSRTIFNSWNWPFSAYHTDRAATFPLPDGLMIYFAIMGLLVTNENLRRRAKPKEDDTEA